MTDDALEIVRGSGNVYRDFEYADADIRQAKAIMGAEIIKILDDKGLSTRKAEARTGIAHSEFSCIRRASFKRFTIDRLMAILARLGQEVELTVHVHPRSQGDSGSLMPVNF